MTFPDTQAEALLLDEDASSAAQVDHAVIPAVFKTLDLRKSGFLRPTRKGFASVQLQAPAVGGLAVMSSMVTVRPDRSVAVYALSVALFDALAAGDPDIEAAPVLLAPANFARVIMVQPPYIGAEPATDALVAEVPTGPGSSAPWLNGRDKAGIVLSWTAAAVQTIRFTSPLILHGNAAGATADKVGLRVVWDRVQVVADVDGAALWLDCADAPRGAEPW